jgi:lipopolysaccharide export system protein LptA
MKFNPANLIRIAIAAFLLAVLFLIGWNFISQSKKKSKVPIQSEQIATQKVEKREKIEYFEVKGERGNFKVRADKHYMGKDERYHLEGNVEVVFFKRKEGEDIFVYAEEIIYDQEWNHFLAKGQGRLRFKDILIESSSIDYDSQKEMFSTKERVQFTSRSVSGSAQRMIYSLKEEQLILQDDIFFSIMPHLETSFPIEVSGRRFEYSRKTKSGFMEGNVFISHGRSQAWADYMEFDLFSSEEQLKNLLLKGQVHAILIEEEAESSPQRATFVLHGSRREVEAGEVRIRGFIDLPKVRTLEARGGCSFKFFSSQGALTHIQGEFIEFVLSREGQLQEFRAKDRVRITERDDKKEELRVLQGEMINAEADMVLKVSGVDNKRPRILFKKSEINADEISLFLESGDLEVKGEVKMALRLEEREVRKVGFFSKDKPIFILAQEMRYSEEKKRFIFKKNVKMWQDKKTLEAEKVGLEEEKGNLSCSGDVKSVVPYKPKDREEERLEVSAQIMSFGPEENVISFAKKSSLKLKDIQLQAQSIHIHLEKEEGEMERIVAHKNVVVIQNQREGRGEEGIYELVEDTFVLLGNPLLIDKNKGKIRGDKLTFHMGDGRIVVENKERERSVTIIKS